jgi:hypothetical protein
MSEVEKRTSTFVYIRKENKIYTDFCFVTRLIITKIDKVQWVDFKLENILVSIHSLKTMSLGHFGASAFHMKCTSSSQPLKGPGGSMS